jgi:cytochrome c peroxidase
MFKVVPVAVVFWIGSLGGLCSAQSQSDAPPRARSFQTPVPAARRAFPIGTPVAIPTPLGLPPVPIPADNPPNAATIALGRRLFFDKIFSRDNTVSCASCHDPKAAMADPRQFSLGVGNAPGNRNAPAIFNAAYNSLQFWDGRARSLEQQAEGPVGNPVEFQHSLVGVERRLSADPTYVAQFAAAWGPGAITYKMVEKSIASYERTLITGNSPFDRYFYGGDQTAMNASAIRGLRLFLNPSLNGPSCVNCHRINNQFATLDDNRFHNTGVAWDPERQLMKDPGRAAVAPNEPGRTNGAFKSPTLRNIALTAPYQHDGSQKTLEEVIDFYFQGGRANFWLSTDMPRVPFEQSIVPRGQEAQAKADLVEFMKALTSDPPPGAAAP